MTYDLRESQAEAAACAQIERDQAHHQANNQGESYESNTNAEPNIWAADCPLGGARDFSGWPIENALNQGGCK